MILLVIVAALGFLAGMGVGLMLVRWERKHPPTRPVVIDFTRRRLGD